MPRVGDRQFDRPRFVDRKRNLHPSRHAREFFERCLKGQAPSLASSRKSECCARAGSYFIMAKASRLRAGKGHGDHDPLKDAL
jgi:hypothetical protein